MVTMGIFPFKEKSPWQNRDLMISSRKLQPRGWSLPTNIFNFKYASFNLQNSIYVFDWNIIAFQSFVVSCFGQLVDVTMRGSYVQGFK
jgi:hypothetical protein